MGDAAGGPGRGATGRHVVTVQSKSTAQLNIRSRRHATSMLLGNKGAVRAATRLVLGEPASAQRGNASFELRGVWSKYAGPANWSHYIPSPRAPLGEDYLSLLGNESGLLDVRREPQVSDLPCNVRREGW